MSHRNSIVSLPRDNSPHSYPAYALQTESYSGSCHYSDTFDSEDSGQDTRLGTPATRRIKKDARNDHSVSMGPQKASSKSHSSTSTNYGKSAAKRSSGTARKSGGNSTNRSMSLLSGQQTPRKANEVAQRMLSAKGHTISRLRNELEEIRLKYDDSVAENKLIMQVQRRQERALSRYQNDEAELPSLLKKHSAELDSLNRRIRKYQQRDKEKERRAIEQHKQLLNTKNDLRQLQHLAQDKDLKERSQLQKRVDRFKEEVEIKDKRLQDLEKYIENMKKNHRRTEHEWRVKELDIKNRLHDAEEEKNDLRYKLKERERELDVRNIYTHRIGKYSTRLISATQSTPRAFAVTKSTSVEELRDKPSQRTDKSPRNEIVRRRSSVEAELSLAEHGQYKKDLDGTGDTKKSDLKSTEEAESFLMKDIREEEAVLSGDGTVDAKEDNNVEVELSPSPHREATFEKKEIIGNIQDDKSPNDEKEDEHLKILKMLDADVHNLESKKPAQISASQKIDSSEGTKKVFGATDNNGYKPTWLFGDSTETGKPTSDEEEQLIKDTISSGKNSSSVSATQKVEEVKDDKPTPRVVKNVYDLHQNSVSAISVKTDGIGKDGITFNIDWKEESDTTQDNDYQKKKELLLARMKAIDEGASNGRVDSAKSQNDYKFTRPVQNLHNGRPSHPEVKMSPKSGRRVQSYPLPGDDHRKEVKSDKIDFEDVSFGNYHPSFTKQIEPNKGNKQQIAFGDSTHDDLFWSKNSSKQRQISSKPTSNQNSLLFNGSNSRDRDSRNSVGGEYMFSASTTASHVADNTLPWESGGLTPTAKPNQNTTSFGSGSKQNSVFATSYSQQKSLFASKAITTAHSDEVDDDIEEYIL